MMLNELFKLLEQFEIFFYVFLGIIAFIYSQRLIVAIDELKDATFQLEREAAMRRFRSALGVIILLLLFAGLIFISITFIAPNIPWDGLLSTPTMDLLATPTPTIEPTEEVVLFPNEQTPTPNTNETGCVPGILEWNYPLEGDQISGVVEPLGTVNFPNLGFYKYEYAPVDSETWTSISVGNVVVENAPLGGVWNTELVTPGEYMLRLVAIDSQNNYLPPCLITVQIKP